MNDFQELKNLIFAIAFYHIFLTKGLIIAVVGIAIIVVSKILLDSVVYTKEKPKPKRTIKKRTKKPIIKKVKK